ncbi:C69 family dipeptidase [Clostridium lundense]|uniref:C69 family dipeptidase n=1 Tax=Clostridium lundense TaxID=319475 RepID=UPI0004861C06|nr:C69 family dipeptidase [Clostridium lundense]
MSYFIKRSAQKLHLPKIFNGIFFTLVLVFSFTSFVFAKESDSYNQGVNFGKEYKTQILQNLKDMKEKSKQNNVNYSDLKNKVVQTENIYKELLPQKLQWIKGISDSTGISYDDLLIFNTFDKNLVGFEGECTTFLAHGKALKDGQGTMVMKNRDVGATSLCEVAIEEGASHANDAIYEAAYIDIPQANKTYKFIGSRTAGRWGYAMGINEHQVIVSDNDAPSRDTLAFKSGLHDNDVIRLILERAKTAKEGVEIAAKLSEKYGIAWGGIMFEIGDQNELWVVEVTGHRWAAKKYDNTVSARSNQYQIEDDYDLCSSDLVSFAVKQGWVKEGTKKLNFKKTYGSDILYPEDNDLSKRRAAEKMYTTEQRYQRALSIMKNNFGKITLDTMMTGSRDHYDTYTLPSGKVVETNQIPFYSMDDPKYADWTNNEFVINTPKEDKVSVNLYIRGLCSHDLGWGRTMSSAVLYSRPNVPNELGLMLHSFAPPCNSAYVPFYVGADKVHPDFEGPEAAALFQQIDTRTFGFYKVYHDAIRARFAPYEKDTLDKLPEIEKQYIQLKSKDSKKAIELLNNFSMNKCSTAIDLAKEVQKDITRLAVEKNSWAPRKNVQVFVNGKEVNLPNKNLLLDQKSPSFVQTKFIFESMGYKFDVKTESNGQTIINIVK